MEAKLDAKIGNKEGMTEADLAAFDEYDFENLPLETDADADASTDTVEPAGDSDTDTANTTADKKSMIPTILIAVLAVFLILVVVLVMKKKKRHADTRKRVEVRRSIPVGHDRFEPGSGFRCQRNHVRLIEQRQPEFPVQRHHQLQSAGRPRHATIVNASRHVQGRGFTAVGRARRHCGWCVGGNRNDT